MQSNANISSKTFLRRTGDFITKFSTGAEKHADGIPKLPYSHGVYPDRNTSLGVRIKNVQTCEHQTRRRCCQRKMELVLIPLYSEETFLTAAESIHSYVGWRRLVPEGGETACESSPECNVARVFSVQNSTTLLSQPYRYKEKITARSIRIPRRWSGQLWDDPVKQTQLYQPDFRRNSSSAGKNMKVHA